MEITQWVVVVGSIADGFRLYGPFTDHDVALRYADIQIDPAEAIPLLKLDDFYVQTANDDGAGAQA